jgi:hypothetical protein
LQKSVFLTCAAACASAALCQSTPPAMELWYQHHSYITSVAALQASEAIVDQAAAAGYTGLEWWDTSLGVINLPGWPQQNVGYLKQFIAYATSKGLRIMPSVFPYGYSNDVLRRNPNWAEGQRITGAQFQVNAAGNALNFRNSFPGFQNPGFESGATGWFSYGDAGLSIDTSTAHTGLASAVISNAPQNSRLYQQFDVQPWRQYHFRVWVKSRNLNNRPSLYIFDSTDLNSQRLNETVPVSPTQDWTAYDWTINSGASSKLGILMGIWGGASGQVWFDDILLEETALVYVLRRPGTPLRVYNPANPTVVYNENTDYNYISEPKFATNATFDNDNWHTPVTPTLPAGTTLKPGQTVAMDFYAVQPIYNAQVGMCLTEPALLQNIYDSTNALIGIMPPASPYLLGYDEMRHMNSCALCKSKNMTPGQLLAWNMGQTVNFFRNASALSPLYVWSDMFDPFHNAHNDYYLAEGDISGSWQGLPPNMTVMNWNLGNLAASLKFFAGVTAQQTTPFRQIVAGFYDPPGNDGAAAASTIFQQAAGIPGIAGVMYTTWADNYTQLGAFAAAAKTAWPVYWNTVAPRNTGSIAGSVTDASGHAIANALITAITGGGSTATVTTSATGAYQIANLAAGAWSVTASASGYTSATGTITVSASSASTLNLKLTATAASFSPIRINAGGGAYTDSSGNHWGADADFVNGRAYSITNTIANTATPALYQDFRIVHGTLHYVFPDVPNGAYIVNLKFAEPWNAKAGARVFNIAINGAVVAPNFDIAAAGGLFAAVDRSFTVNVSSGSIDLQLAGVKLYPLINAIEIMQSR